MLPASSAQLGRVRGGGEVQLALDADPGGEGVLGPLGPRRVLELKGLRAGEDVGCVLLLVGVRVRVRVRVERARKAAVKIVAVVGL